MPTVPAGAGAYGGFPGQTNGANITTIQTPFSNQVVVGNTRRRNRLARHRVNRTITATTTAVSASASVGNATDAINTVRLADRVPATLVNGKRTGRVRRIEQGAVATLGSRVGGTGYTNAAYTNVILVPTVASQANLAAGGCAADITVSGGVVTVCTLVAARNGEGYTAGMVLTAQPGSIGPGTGFTITAATIGFA